MEQHRLIQQAFSKYDGKRKGFLSRLEVKCAFIYLTGFKPGKQDMEIFKNGN